ncbi:MAG: DUF58 domain-containing protein [Bacteroidota bacterium]|mgnify:CR=1 FL=1
MSLTTQELVKKVRQIEIKTRGLVNHIFSGEYHSVFKGRGMEFSEVREYTIGDDVRMIDWNVSARMNKTFVKTFEEERELTLLLIVDVSSSNNFGGKTKTKMEVATELCATLAFSAIKNSDKVGLILFSDKVEKYLPPKKGKQHVFRILRELINNIEPKNKLTNISKALQYANRVTKKRAICFIVSDFIDSDFSDSLRILSKRNDVIAIKLSDLLEREIPKIGLVGVRDSENNSIRYVDLNSIRTESKYYQLKYQSDEEQKKIITRAKVDTISIKVEETFWKPLTRFFKNRERKLNW